MTATAWIYLVRESHDMRSMSMVIDSVHRMTAQTDGWAGDLGLRVAMWVAMMIGMMIPTAAPMTLVYAAVARRARELRSPLPPTSVFVAGYILTWSLFSVAAAFAQWALDQASMLSSTMASNDTRLGGALLLAAGIYQFTPLKQSCLRQCRSPAEFLSDHWRDGGVVDAVRLGAHHGAYCLGCCWVLMALLFVVGVMNLLWVAVIAVFVLTEKTLSFGRLTGRIAGTGLVTLGLAGLTGIYTIG